MTGSGPLVPELQDVRRLLVAASRMGGPQGAVLELCILTLCLPWQAVAIDLENIDWNNGLVDVPARSGRMCKLTLPDPAMKCILRVAGTGPGSGQAVTAGRGERLQARHLRLDRLQDQLARAVPETIHLKLWNFFGIRAAAASAMLDAGIPSDAVETALNPAGQLPLEGRTGISERTRAELARQAIDAWCRILLSTTNAPDRQGDRSQPPRAQPRERADERDAAQVPGRAESRFQGGA